MFLDIFLRSPGMEFPLIFALIGLITPKISGSFSQTTSVPRFAYGGVDGQDFNCF
jgi:hypothetical protein